MADQDLSVDLRLMLLLDAQSLERVKKGISTPLEELERKHRKKFGVNVDSSSAVKEGEKIKKSFKGMEDQSKRATKATGSFLRELEGQLDRVAKKVDRLSTSLDKLKTKGRGVQTGAEKATVAPTTVQTGQALALAGTALTLSAVSDTKRTAVDTKQQVETLGTKVDSSEAVREAHRMEGALKGVEDQADATTKALQNVSAAQPSLAVKLDPDAPPPRLGSVPDLNDLERQAQEAARKKQYDLANLEPFRKAKTFEEAMQIAPPPVHLGYGDKTLSEVQQEVALAKEADRLRDSQRQSPGAGGSPEAADWLRRQQEEMESELDAVNETYTAARAMGRGVAEEYSTLVTDLIKNGRTIEEASREGLAMMEARKRGEDAPIRPLEEVRAEKEAEEAKRKQAVAAAQAANAEKERAHAAKQASGETKKSAAEAGTYLEEYKKLAGQGGRAVQESEKEKQKALEKTALLLRREAALHTRRAEVATRAAARIQQVSQSLIIGGSALTLGVFAEANRYVNSVKKPTEATEEWTKATNELARARARVDEVIVRQSLPIMREIANIATKTAGFVERNPQIVSGALKAGVILAGIGGIGMLVSKGLRVYADFQYSAAVGLQNTAAQIMLTASKNQLTAAGIMATDANPSKVPSLATRALPVLGIGAAVAGNVGASFFINTELEKLQEAMLRTGKSIPVVTTVMTALYGGIGQFFPVLPAIRDTKNALADLAERSPLFAKFMDIVKGKIDDVLGTNLSGSSVVDELKLAGSANEEAIVAAFTKWREDDARLVREAAEARKQIIADSEREVVEITRRNRDRVVEINRQANEARRSIIMNFIEESNQAEREYEDARAEIIRDSGEDIQEIERDHQERLRKMKMDHDERMDEFARTLDALGAVKEQRRYNREKAEAERETNLEIAQTRRDIARRLQELSVQYAVERAQRQEQYQADLAENQRRRQEALKEAAEAHAAELRQAREAKEARLRELQEGLDAERARRREVLIAEIRDLDASLLGEREKKREYYSLMLQDAEKWLQDYRATLAQGVRAGRESAPVRDTGGYVTKGLYQMAKDGAREFVMSGPTTRAAERAIGNSLTQQSILGALNGGSRQQIVYNDQRRMEVPLSTDHKNLYRQGAEEALMGIIGGS